MTLPPLTACCVLFVRSSTNKKTQKNKNKRKTKNKNHQNPTKKENQKQAKHKQTQKKPLKMSNVLSFSQVSSMVNLVFETRGEHEHESEWTLEPRHFYLNSRGLCSWSPHLIHLAVDPVPPYIGVSVRTSGGGNGGNAAKALPKQVVPGIAADISPDAKILCDAAVNHLITTTTTTTTTTTGSTKQLNGDADWSGVYPIVHVVGVDQFRDLYHPGLVAAAKQDIAFAVKTKKPYPEVPGLADLKKQFAAPLPLLSGAGGGGVASAVWATEESSLPVTVATPSSPTAAAAAAPKQFDWSDALERMIWPTVLAFMEFLTHCGPAVRSRPVAASAAGGDSKSSTGGTGGVTVVEDDFCSVSEYRAQYKHHDATRRLLGADYRDLPISKHHSDLMAAAAAAEAEGKSNANGKTGKTGGGGGGSDRVTHYHPNHVRAITTLIADRLSPALPPELIALICSYAPPRWDVRVYVFPQN